MRHSVNSLSLPSAKPDIQTTLASEYSRRNHQDLLQSLYFNRLLIDERKSIAPSGRSFDFVS